MVIVHVAIVSGCLLSSNNPSTTIASVAQTLTAPEGTLIKGAQDDTLIFRWFGITEIFDTPFQPVPLWDRGCMKKSWLERTAIWSNPDLVWFKPELRLTKKEFIWIGVSAWLLIFAPTLMAFLVSYSTPRICVSCRSFTFALYLGCQTILIIAATLRSRYYQLPIPNPSNRIRTKLSRLISLARDTITYFFPVLAINGSVFTGFVGTLIQIIGVFRNCTCSTPVSSWLSPSWGEELINVANDTQEQRQSSKYWLWTGVAAIVFMSVVCYGGWWYQRYLRSRFAEILVELTRA